VTGKVLLVVAHAPSPRTARLRDAVLDGARAAGGPVVVRSVAPLDAGPEDLLTAAGVILGTTENLGYMSGALKDFFDRSYYPCLERTQGIPYALFVRAGHDGTGTCRAVAGIATGLRWREVQAPLVCRGDWREGFVDGCRDLGAAFAAGLDAGVF
jgi:multimeric flavodoxin WrbA